MKVSGILIPEELEQQAIAAMRPANGIDYFENWDIAQVLRSFAKQHDLDAEALAGRLLQREARSGHVLHRGRGQWVLLNEPPL